MKKILINSVLLIIFPLILSAQLTSLVPLDYEVVYKTADRELFELEMYNSSSDTISIKWSIEYNFSQSSDFQAEVSDFTQEYMPSILSSCDLPFLNILPPGDTSSFFINLITRDISSEVLMDGPEIILSLWSGPDCDSNLLTYSFRIIDQSVSTIDNEVQPLVVFPNPSSDYIYLSNPNQNSAQILIYNSIGELTYEKYYENFSNDVKLDISVLPNGIYSLKCIPEGSLNNTSYNIQFVKYDH